MEKNWQLKLMKRCMESGNQVGKNSASQNHTPIPSTCLNWIRRRVVNLRLLTSLVSELYLSLYFGL